MNKFRLSTFMIVALLGASLLSGCFGAGATSAVQNWPGLTLDSENGVGYVSNGSHVYAIDLNNGAEIWRFPAQPERNLGFSAPPALTVGGQLVVGAYNHFVYSLDPETGQQNWVNQDATNRYYAGSLPLGELVYSPNIDHSLYAVDQSGNLDWKIETDGPLWSTPATDGEIVYLAGMDHSIYALNPENGATIWQSPDLGGSMSSSPVLGADRQLYVGTYGNEMLAIDASNGDVIWRTPVSGWVHSTPAMADGVLYFGDVDGTFYALDAETGGIKWQTQPDTTSKRAISGTPLVMGEKVFFNNKAGTLYSADLAAGNATPIYPKGDEKRPALYAPVLGDGETIYIAPMGTGPVVIALDANGNQKWAFTPAK